MVTCGVCGGRPLSIPCGRCAGSGHDHDGSLVQLAARNARARGSAVIGRPDMRRAERELGGLPFKVDK